MLWGWPFSVWETAIKVSLWIAGVGGVLAAIAAFLAGYVGYELSGAVQRKSDEAIAGARRDASFAQAEAAKAIENAAHANERSVSLEKDAAKARACPQLGDSQAVGCVFHGLSADSELTDASLRPSR